MVAIETIGYSLLTGGLVATVVELIHYTVKIYRHKKFVSRLRKFFIELNKKIEIATGTNDGRISQQMIRFVIFRDELEDIKTLISAYQPYLKTKELSEIQEIINQEFRLIRIIPSNTTPDTKMYAQFFDRLTKLKWLKYTTL